MSNLNSETIEKNEAEQKISVPVLLEQDKFFDTSPLTAGLKARVVRGGMWVFALRITSRLFQLARTIVIARLLAPSDFGVFGIALLAMSALSTFSQTGFNAALVQKKQDTKHYLDTAWTVQAIRGGVLALIAFAIAPYVAAFFDAPAAKRILQVIALSVLLQGFTNIGVVYFQKELQFHKQFIYQLSGTLADIGVAISAAFLLRSVWALVPERRTRSPTEWWSMKLCFFWKVGDRSFWVRSPLLTFICWHAWKVGEPSCSPQSCPLRVTPGWTGAAVTNQHAKSARALTLIPGAKGRTCASCTDSPEPTHISRVGEVESIERVEDLAYS